MLKNIHCCRCGRYLGNEDIKEGKVELKCPKCKQWTVIQALKVKENDDNQ